MKKRYKIALNVIPDYPLMEAVFADIVDDVIIVKNGQGQVFWPAFGINQIGDWIITDGYKVKMSSARDLVISGGTIAQPDATIYNLEKVCPFSTHFVPILKSALSTNSLFLYFFHFSCLTNCFFAP